MCGIMGYYSFGNTLPDKNKITKMFTLLEVRGRDASGCAYIKSNELIINKAALPSSKFIQTKEWADLSLPKIMILHTRLKTQGEPTNNMNNHPLFTKKGLAIVHNGMIYNDKEIFGRKQKRDAEVDSEAILSILSNNGKPKSLADKVKKLFERLDGGFAVASIDKADPQRLLLVRKENPIDLYYNAEDDILYFCSERNIMQKALGIAKKSKRGFNTGEGDYHFYEMEDNHALIINNEGVGLYKRYYPANPRWYHSSHWDDELIVECPYCLGATTYQWGRLFNRCDICGQAIEEEDVYV